MRLVAVPLFALTLLGAADALSAQAGLFSTPEPELIYTSNGPDLTEGVIVIRDEESWKEATAHLDPAYAGPVPNFKDRTVLRIVGRPRETRCRDTALIQVETKNLGATATVEERVPDKNCSCADDARPPKVFLVTVAHRVRRAEVIKTDRVTPCPEAEVARQKTESKPVLLFEGSWSGEPGGKLIADPAEYRQVLTRLGFPDRGPVVDFEHDRVVTVTGRPRENGCRQTRVTGTALASPTEAVFEVEEVYAAKGAACGKTMMLPLLFLYRVPATVMTVRVVTKDSRP